jgi:hypothetical protein
MRPRATLVSIGAALPAVVLMAHGCREATQLTLDIGTNVVCADMRGVDIIVASNPRAAEHRAALDAPGTRFATATTSECIEGAAPRKIGTLVVTPSGGDGAVVVVAAFGGARAEDCIAPRFGPGCIVARRKFSFVDHTAVTLPIVLDPVCAGVPCDENSTCVGAKCVDSKVDCSGGTCSPPGEVLPDGGVVLVDAPSQLDGAGGDGAVVDGGGDASAHDAASTDAAEGGFNDAGAGTCPMAVSCLGVGPICSSPDVALFCCYSPATSCVTAGLCAGLSGCCRSSDDCNAGDICCASTATATLDTVVTCRPRTECLANTGTPVCNTPGNDGCGPGHVCIGSTYSTTPQYFSCS